MARLPNTCYIYVLLDPRDGEVRYVGRTQRNVRQRLINHMSIEGGAKKREWIIELRKLSLRAEITVIEEVPASQFSAIAAEREVYWIRFYLEQGASLINDLKVVRYYSQMSFKTILKTHEKSF